MSGMHRKECEAFRRRILAGIPGYLHLKPAEFIMLSAGLYGFMGLIQTEARQSPPQRARVQIAVLCSYLVSEEEYPRPAAAFAPLTRYFSDSALGYSPNDSFPQRPWSFFHFVFIACMRKSFLSDATTLIPRIAFFILMGADPRIFFSMTAISVTEDAKNLHMRFFHGEERILLEDVPVRTVVKDTKMTPNLYDYAWDTETKVSLEQLVQHLFPEGQNPLQAAIQDSFRLHREGPVTAAQRAQLRNKFSKTLHGLISSSRTKLPEALSTASPEADSFFMLTVALLANRKETDMEQRGAR
ncbi:hypothetical protein BDW74DRAFT_183125 [Aspergillus multicolor]|uniref:uncharacterized protein n=1 Tax=Aspergillus multicolor TaxID=41759 RepID=UPI003CCD5E99